MHAESSDTPSKKNNRKICVPQRKSASKDFLCVSVAGSVNMKFIADVMLGRLAKRLRLLGFDVLYDRMLSDNEIIRLSLEQVRTILTRDTGLAARPLAACNLFITSDRIREQIDQVLAFIHPEMEVRPLTRCTICNERLIPIKKEDLHDRVPAYVHERYNTFVRCTVCGRIYWQGTHVKRMNIGQIKTT
jgi:uncharacterized protein with PIN domain